MISNLPLSSNGMYPRGNMNRDRFTLRVNASCSAGRTLVTVPIWN